MFEPLFGGFVFQAGATYDHPKGFACSGLADDPCLNHAGNGKPVLSVAKEPMGQGAGIRQ
jgi:hypothetical protein